jgi:hypothetical protein
VAIERKGKAVNLTLEAECVDILRVLCPGGKSYGMFISALIRAEERRRRDERQLRQKLDALVTELTT